MRAAYLTRTGDLDALEVGELPVPELREGHVRVKVRFAALNHLDIWVRQGMPNLELAFPHVLCGDGSGVVSAAGPNSHLKVGDEVILHPGISCGKCEHCTKGIESLCPRYRILGEHIWGTAAEYVVVPEENCFKKPKRVSFEEAASLGLVFVTAWQMLVNRAHIREGQWVLIHAAGSGVSSAGIQIAKLFRARVIATASKEENLRLAQDLGAEVTINYKAQDFLKEVKRVTDGKGVDVILDHVGESIWESNLKALKWGGTLVTCGASSGPKGKTDLAHLFYRQLSLLGSTMGSKRDFPTILEHFEKGHFRGVIDQIFPLDQARLAHERLESRQQSGKVLLAIGG